MTAIVATLLTFQACKASVPETPEQVTEEFLHSLVASNRDWSFESRMSTIEGFLKPRCRASIITPGIGQSLDTWRRKAGKSGIMGLSELKATIASQDKNQASVEARGVATLTMKGDV